MHSEDQDKTYSKGQNQRTASQFDAHFSAAKVSIYPLVERLENNMIQCAASPQLIRMHKSSIGTEFRTFSMEIYTPPELPSHQLGRRSGKREQRVLCVTTTKKIGSEKHE